ncbi:MAG: hypothetical protein WC343_11450 [Bacilli bacterium]|jgi:hypothetical protein
MSLIIFIIFGAIIGAILFISSISHSSKNSNTYKYIGKGKYEVRDREGKYIGTFWQNKEDGLGPDMNNRYYYDKSY